MKRKTLTLLLAVLLAVTLAAQADEQAFEKARTLIFDRQWGDALKQLETVIAAGPASRRYPAALFYQAKCREEMGAAREALECYERFLAVQPEGSLAEDARVSVIDLAGQLYQDGQKQYLEKITRRLGDRNKVVSYYAAFKLSYLPDRNRARQALPVLESILKNEKDEELRDRARIAVMRIAPSRLRDKPGAGKPAAGRMLKIRILDRRSKREEVLLNLPLALADLAIRSLSPEQKRSLGSQGYDLNDILARLTKEGLKIEIESEEGTFQMWVE